MKHHTLLSSQGAWLWGIAIEKKTCIVLSNDGPNHNGIWTGELSHFIDVGEISTRRDGYDILSICIIPLKVYYHSY